MVGLMFCEFADTLSQESSPQVAELVTLLQLTDSAFPTGRYIHSYGLEAFAQEQEGLVTDAAALLDMLRDAIRFGVARSDGVALACAHRAVSRRDEADVALLIAADHRLTAVKLAREARDASIRMGRALLREAAGIFGGGAVLEFARLVEGGESPGNHAVAFGIVSASSGIPQFAAIASELYAFAASWVAAATRLGLTDYHTAQDLLSRLRAVIAKAVSEAAWCAVSDISSGTPLLDIMAMRHEQAPVRLFAS